MDGSASNARESTALARRNGVLPGHGPDKPANGAVRPNNSLLPDADRHKADSHPGEPGPAMPNLATSIPKGLFRTFFAGGFECSTHFRRPGVRLDLIHATAHDRFAALDYQRLAQQGIRVTREGVRWHLTEPAPGKYDFASVAPITAAARQEKAQVIWDLCHFGWPEHLDLFDADFPRRLAEFGVKFVQWLVRELEGPPFIVPVNEISYFSWAAGDEGSMYPFTLGRGFELKTQLVRATIQTIQAIRSVAPQTRFVQVDPIIHVVADPKHPEEAQEAEAYRRSQYQAWDMLCCKAFPELGGAAEFLDVIGVNFYPHNQWIYNLKNMRRVRRFQPIQRKNPLYRPFREMLMEVYDRFQRPMFIAKTGAENRRRAPWFDYVCEESEQAIQAGVPLHGICLYPVVNHPGWADDRHCHNALWDYPDEQGHREIYKPLALQLKRWQTRLGSPEPNPRPQKPISRTLRGL